MRKLSNTTDANGWTWIFRNNNNYNSKPIDNPHHRDLEKVATSFYVSNLPDSLDAKGLWNACVKYGRLVDSFIANKRSKGGKRFGFIRFLGIKDDTEFVKLLSNIWIGSYHLYVTVARYQRTNSTGSKSTKQVLTKEENPKTKPNPNSQFAEYAPSKPSFASVIHNKPTKIDTTTSHVNTKTVTLKDQDLISVEDSSTVLLLKLKDVDTMSNMYTICKSEGFMDLKIHHVGGLWIWIQFPSSSSCSKFQDNVTLKSFYTILKYASPSFKVDERMVWIEISGLPLCAWGSNAFKKVACMFGKFMFFEAEESTAMSSGRVCISTRSHYRISEKVNVEVHGELFDVHVHELGTWSTSITDNSLDTFSNVDINDINKVEDVVEENPIEDSNDLNDNLNDLAQELKEDEVHEDDLNVNSLMVKHQTLAVPLVLNI
ncbi:RNA-directed DNA polymerase, eukaryota, reverse transcriptase zinc-binding domain protein [Tanacetum coccineum]